MDGLLAISAQHQGDKLGSFVLFFNSGLGTVIEHILLGDEYNISVSALALGSITAYYGVNFS